MADRDSTAQAKALTALNRFGLGAGPDREAVTRALLGDPRGRVLAELEEARANPAFDPMPATPLLHEAYFASGNEVLAARRGFSASMSVDGPANAGARVAMQKPRANASAIVVSRVLLAEFSHKLELAARMPLGIVERLVAFWSNHFSVSIGKSTYVGTLAGAFEREAIRPFVLGRFSDMLAAVARHPAMLAYLDNNVSFGPNSRLGQRLRRGLNENLAREILELHTLGVDGGYEQKDVTSFAAILTGWSYNARATPTAARGTFLFNAGAHEPGAKTLLGKTYPENGIAEGETALADLARHPKTARFLATKLARHFSRDEPPPALVDRLSAVFLETGGDLMAVTRALVTADESWQAPGAKMRAPLDLALAMHRTAPPGFFKPLQLYRALRDLGQPLWNPGQPNGYADTVETWASPVGMKFRLDLSASLSHALVERLEPGAFLETVAAGAASAETVRAVRQAETRELAMTLILMSPEFQRR